VSQDAKTQANKLKANAEYRRKRRANDENFAKSERASNQKYRDRMRCEEMFAKAFAKEFHQFTRGIVSAPRPMVPEHMAATPAPQIVPTGSTMPVAMPSRLTMPVDRRAIPSAQQKEQARIGPALDVLK
jgi:hypothetical protein